MDNRPAQDAETTQRKKKRRSRPNSKISIEAQRLTLNHQIDVLAAAVKRNAGRTDKQKEKRNRNLQNIAELTARLAEFGDMENGADQEDGREQPSFPDQQIMPRSSAIPIYGPPPTASLPRRMNAVTIHRPVKSAETDFKLWNDPRTQAISPQNLSQSNIQGHYSVNSNSFQIPIRPHEAAKEQVGPEFTVTAQISMPPSRYSKRHTDPKVPPSAASGGVPEPSQEYLSRCSLSPIVKSFPQSILLVIDLNGTILFRPNKTRSAHFIERPNTKSFLQYALANFHVMVWSSAKPENVDRMCQLLFPGPSRKQLVGIWGRNRMGLSPGDYAKRVQVYKRLGIIWNNQDIQAKHPQAVNGGFWDQRNTILLDDSFEKARSEPHNLVQVPEFNGQPEAPSILEDLAQYLTDLKFQEDVSSYMRLRPFRFTNHGWNAINTGP